jgi:double-stranded uracil-DNA glycosylase
MWNFMMMLPDHLRADLSVVFCGTAAGNVSATRGHYYADPRNQFWRFLFEARFTPFQFTPEHDKKICHFGLGLTDLVKNVSSASDKGLRGRYCVSAFLQKVELFKPSWVAFHGREAANAVARHLGFKAHAQLGKQPWRIEPSAIFVLPNASGSSCDPRHHAPKLRKVDWSKELAQTAMFNGSCSP